MLLCLAGRSEDGVRSLAARLRLPSRMFALDSPAGLREGIAGAAVVLHAAGPFSATSRPMVDACLAAGAHYVDVTGEIAVLEAVAARDPDLILTTAVDTPSFQRRPEWQVLRAVRQRHFVRVHGSEFDRPGPRSPAAITALTAALFVTER